jgi:hypothetical protein
MSYKQTWPTPKLYGVGHFIEFNLYREALMIAKSKGYIDKSLLTSEIPQRVKGLILIDSISETVYADLIRELVHYGFIKREAKNDLYKIDDEGLYYLDLCYSNNEKALDVLLDKMQKVFITPAWFVSRLWELNQKGQGQIVIPLPLKSWHPELRKWSDNSWTAELEDVSIDTIRLVKKKIQGSFPYDEDEWINDLSQEYRRLGSQNPRINKPEIPDDAVNYSQRNRLSLAMKTIAVKKFFSRYNPITNEMDFPNKRSDMTHRSFMVWCPRLEKFNLICYTDNNPEVPGRLLYPISSFKENCLSKDFTVKEFVTDVYNKRLFIHNPKWESIKDYFISTLLEVYQTYYNKQTIIYISLQDIRDEVCRLLRISPFLFERFLKITYEMSIRHEINYSISLETDIRLDMKVQINRRGVYLNGIMYSLIAIKPL